MFLLNDPAKSLENIVPQLHYLWFLNHSGKCWECLRGLFIKPWIKKGEQTWEPDHHRSLDPFQHFLSFDNAEKVALRQIHFHWFSDWPLGIFLEKSCTPSKTMLSQWMSRPGSRYTQYQPYPSFWTLHGYSCLQGHLGCGTWGGGGVTARERGFMKPKWVEVPIMGNLNQLCFVLDSWIFCLVQTSSWVTAHCSSMIRCD